MADIFNPDYDKWTPPEELFIVLNEGGLYSRDKVEIVYAFYAHDHGGQGPYAREIAEVLGVSKKLVELKMKELIERGRAEKINGKFSLVKSDYSHPSIICLIRRTTP